MIFNRMRLYTVHVKPGQVNPYERPEFVSEGFNIYAFLFTIFWSLYYRLWSVSLALLAVNLAPVFLAQTHILSMDSVSIIQIAINLLVGFHANDWRRAALARKGYVMVDISAADSLLRAEQRYFERTLAGASHA